jgi:hypothetical protein
VSTPLCTLQKYIFTPSFPHEHWTIQASANPTAIFTMQLNHGLHLAYSTNIHRGGTWRETFDSLKTHALAVRERVCPRAPFAIGLRLSNLAATELHDAKKLLEFQRWLAKNDCYIFTINGFPFGQFHGARVKEQVYLPDWTSPERLAYTNLLFDLLAQLLPTGIEGSVSTLPCSFKEFVAATRQSAANPNKHKEAALCRDAATQIRENLWRCVEYISHVSEKSKRKLHLGLEPEPLCLIENSAETIQFFGQLRAEHKNDPRLDEFLGVNYDCCHFAIEFEEPRDAINSLRDAGIKISKIHLSSALKTKATKEARAALEKFADDVYLHQVIARDADGKLKFFRDLPDALDLQPSTFNLQPSAEWRIHFHVPLHAPAAPPFENTNDHLLGVLDLLAENPKMCSHLEMETYTWEVLPPELKSQSVVGQLAAEYDWTLAQLKQRGLASNL